MIKKSASFNSLTVALHQQLICQNRENLVVVGLVAASAKSQLAQKKMDNNENKQQ